ncbi:MAG: hypothetical protein IKF17_05705 [Clostridia bacterium]|nr:hypothetical protein [Clostridia bacterium]
MLKIKDDIDLKELEKFGFLKYKIMQHGKVETKYKKDIRAGAYVVNNYIVGTDRIIHYNSMSVHNELDDTIYDLIKADLVEKV